MTEHNPAPAGEHAHHGPSVKAYWIVFFSLAILTLIEIQIPGMMEGDNPARPSTALVSALMITAIFKAGLVAAFYMHLRYDSRTYTYMMLVATAVIMFFLWLLTWGTVGPLNFDLFSGGVGTLALAIA